MTFALTPTRRAMSFGVSYTSARDSVPVFHYDGLYYWDPGRATFAAWQVDRKGNAGAATLKLTRAGWEQEMRISHAGGGEHLTRTELERVDANTVRLRGLVRPAGRTDWIVGIDQLYHRLAPQVSLPTSAARSSLLPPLNPARVQPAVDTIGLFVTRKDSAEELGAMLYRELFRMSIGGRAILRETQRYEAPTGNSTDTLDVDALTGLPVRYFSASRSGSHDVRIEGAHISGWRVAAGGTRIPVDTTAADVFLIPMMNEAFIAAFNLAPGQTVTLPQANPPDARVRPVTLRAETEETIRTSLGEVRAIRVIGPGATVSWISAVDGRLLRMRWVLPDGTTIWKLPRRDAGYR